MSRKIEDLVPEFQPMVKQFLAECEAKGVKVFITRGLSSFAEQKSLHAQGRLDITEVNALRQLAGMGGITSPENNIVTNAKAGFSWHNFGRAIDCAFHYDKNNDGKVQPGEVGYDGDWTKVGQIGETLGLEWGGRFETRFDGPHFQLRGGFTLSQLQAMFPEGWKSL